MYVTEQGGAAVAHELIDVFLDGTENMLAANPNAGRIGRIAGTRELVVHENYIAVYEVTDVTVYVLDVRHVARQWPNSF